MKFTSLQSALVYANEKQTTGAVRVLDPNPIATSQEYVIEVKEGSAWIKNTLCELAAISSREVMLFERSAILVGNTTASCRSINALIIQLDKLSNRESSPHPPT